AVELKLALQGSVQPGEALLVVSQLGRLPALFAQQDFGIDQVEDGFTIPEEGRVLLQEALDVDALTRAPLAPLLFKQYAEPFGAVEAPGARGVLAGGWFAHALPPGAGSVFAQPIMAGCGSESIA